MVHACNASTYGEDFKFEASLGYVAKLFQKGLGV